jgi:glycosyltransferase involved in cell wall biosynthesis
MWMHRWYNAARMPHAAQPPRLKICHVVATTEGASWVFEQLRGLRDRHGHDVAVVLNGASGALVDRFRAEAIRVHVADFDFTSSPDLLDLPRKVLALARLFRRERFDVVQTHLFHSMIIGRIAGWIANVPVRLSMIAGPFHLEAYTPRWIDRATAWMDTGIIASCEHTLKLYRACGVSARRLSLIYYGPDESKFDPANLRRGLVRQEFSWPADAPLIGMVAIFYTEFGRNRWTPPVLHGRAGKGHEELIHATPIVLREFPNAKFLLVGPAWHAGGEKFLARMQALVAELGLKESVVFTGLRNDVPQIYRDLDVSVQASLNENLGGTIESLLMQCPTVATRVGGLTDSIVDGVTGVLVSPADPADVARGILRLLRDPKRARALGEAGRRRMLARFTLSKTIADLHALYIDLVPGKPQPLGRHAPLQAGHPVIPEWQREAKARQTARSVVTGSSAYADDDDREYGHRVNLATPSEQAAFGVGLTDTSSRRNVSPAARAYGNLVFFWRLIVAGVFCCCLALRFLLVDCWLLPSWDQGWRPWRFTSWMVLGRIWLYRCYAVLGRVLPSFGLRHRLCASHPMMMIRLRNAGCALAAMPRMWLYRVYALLGRSASFGLRARLASSRARAAIRLHNAWCGLRAMPRMLVYRVYGTASRGARALGLRRPRSIGTVRSPDVA